MVGLAEQRNEASFIFLAHRRGQVLVRALISAIDRVKELLDPYQLVNILERRVVEGILTGRLLILVIAIFIIILLPVQLVSSVVVLSTVDIATLLNFLIPAIIIVIAAVV